MSHSFCNKPWVKDIESVSKHETNKSMFEFHIWIHENDNKIGWN